MKLECRDETGIDKYFQREKGKAISGQKVEDTKRGRRFQRTNVVGGLCDGKYWAVECYNHTTNSSFFESWFEKNLLCEVPPNDTIVMDNARFHRKEKLYQLAKNEVSICCFYSPILLILIPLKNLGQI